MSKTALKFHYTLESVPELKNSTPTLTNAHSRGYTVRAEKIKEKRRPKT